MVELFVPHMIGLKSSENNENLREKLNIQENATVFGRDGGLDTFNLHFVYNAIVRTVLANNHIYFLRQIYKFPYAHYLILFFYF